MNDSEDSSVPARMQVPTPELADDVSQGAVEAGDGDAAAVTSPQPAQSDDVVTELGDGRDEVGGEPSAVDDSPVALPDDDDSGRVGVRASEPDEPTPLTLGVDHELDRRSVRLHQMAWSLTTGLLAFGFAGAVLVLYLASDADTLLTGLGIGFTVVTVALGAMTERWPKLEHRHARYRVDAEGIEIRRGVFWREVVNVRRSRVQHTDVTQGPLERRFGLGTLVIYTAGSQHARVEVAGLSHWTALAIRRHLVGDLATAETSSRIRADGV